MAHSIDEVAREIVHCHDSSVVLGDIVVIGSIVAISQQGQEANCSGLFWVSGIFEVDKFNTEALTAGDILHYDASSSKFTKSTTGLATGDIKKAAKVIQDAATTATECKVLLTPQVSEKYTS